MKSKFGSCQSNLKGRKTKDLSCGCCSLENFKEKYSKKLDREYIKKNYGK